MCASSKDFEKPSIITLCSKNGYTLVALQWKSVADPGFGRGGPRLNSADIVKWSHASEVSLFRHGVWGLPSGPEAFGGFGSFGIHPNEPI